MTCTIKCPVEVFRVTPAKPAVGQGGRPDHGSGGGAVSRSAREFVGAVAGGRAAATAGRTLGGSATV